MIVSMPAVNNSFVRSESARPTPSMNSSPKSSVRVRRLDSIASENLPRPTKVTPQKISVFSIRLIVRSGVSWSPETQEGWCCLEAGLSLFCIGPPLVALPLARNRDRKTTKPPGRVHKWTLGATAR
jgi:hypothetical protein